MRHAFVAEHEPEIELSQEVIDELAKREAEQEEDARDQEEAAMIIQSLIRKRRARQAFIMLRELAAAVRVITKVARRKRRRTIRRATLLVQARVRAWLCWTRGICRFNTLLVIIDGLRAAHLDAVSNGKLISTSLCSHLSTSVRSRTARRSARIQKTCARTKEGVHASGGAQKVAMVGGATRNASVLQARRQNFINGLLPKHADLPKAHLDLVAHPHGDDKDPDARPTFKCKHRAIASNRTSTRKARTRPRLQLGISNANLSSGSVLGNMRGASDNLCNPLAA